MELSLYFYNKQAELKHLLICDPDVFAKIIRIIESICPPQDISCCFCGGKLTTTEIQNHHHGDCSFFIQQERRRKLESRKI